MSMGFVQEAHARGFVQSCTSISSLNAESLRDPANFGGYIGFDCTADSLHVGSLVQLMLMRMMLRHGHRVVALLGGGTSLIGDPSGKDETRPIITRDTIAENAKGITRVFDQIVSPVAVPEVLNNLDWLSGINYLDLLRDVGSHFSINQMLTRDSVRLRLQRQQPLSFLEFNYLIVQAYDFRHLCQQHGIILQMGGSDQWGNIISGIDLIRRTVGKEAFGLTTPLIETASGQKMGKTAGGAVWLTADRTSPFEYWQFWRNTDDADVGRFLRLFTELPLDEIVRLEMLTGQEINEAKIVLANACTTICHGPEAAQQAAEQARAAFSDHPNTVSLTPILAGRNTIEGCPVYRLVALVSPGMSLGEAKRLVAGRGVRINGEQMSDPDTIMTEAMFPHDRITVQIGKKRFLNIMLNEA